MISEVLPGFTPFILEELSLPQFSIYCKYAKQQKVYQPNLKNINDYLGEILGSKKSKPLPVSEEGKEEREPKPGDVNNLQNFIDAKNRLKAQTGKDSVDIKDVVREIKQFAQLESLRKTQEQME